MKHLCLLLFLFFSISGCLSAQETTSSLTSNSSINSPLQKGNWLVGANIGSLGNAFNSDNSNSFLIFLNPRVGYFVSNNVVIGTQVELSFQTFEKGESISYGLSPFFRYYFPGEVTHKHRWFAEAEAGILRNSFKDDNNDRVINTLFGVSGGYSYFITNSVALEGTLNLNRNHTNIGPGFTNTDLSLGFAFQIYLPGNRNR